MKWIAAVAAVLAACGSSSSGREDAGGSGSGSGSASLAVAVVKDAGVARDAGAGSGSAGKTDAPRIEHAVFSFVDNRHAAHRGVDNDFVIDGGDIGIARYTRFNMPAARWHLGKTVAGEKAATADQLASLEIPLTDQQAKAVQLTMHVHAQGKLNTTLKINGRVAGRSARVPLNDGWQTVSFPIEAGRLVLGENQLTFETSGKGRMSLAWARLGGETSSTEDPRQAAVFDTKDDTIELGSTASVAWFVTVPDGANLVADVPAPCRVEVQARAGDASSAGGLLGGPNARIDLSSMSGKVVRLALTTRECAGAAIKHPRITLHGPEPKLQPPSTPPRYVIVWVMDATRAQNIAAFTPGARAQTPTLDDLAKTGAVFRQYYVQGNESQTSHTSMWTGLYPAVHGVRLAGATQNSLLNPKFATIASKLKAAGFDTVAVTGNGFVNSDNGYHRNFDEFRNLMREGKVPNDVLYGNVVTDLAIKRFDAHRDKPTYMFVGTVDNHSPWVARRPWVDLYSPNYKGPFVDYGTAEGLGLRPDSMGCSVIPPPADLERLRAIYDSEISYTDKQIGRLVAQLKTWGIWDQTMLLITADHGEELFEEQRCGHGGSLRETLLRVPLLIHDPTRFPGGTIVEEGAECVDLLPTILNAVGAAPVPEVQGEPLEAVAQGVGRGWVKPSYTSMYEYAHAMRIGAWKIRVNQFGVPMIGDMVNDRDEHQDAGPTHPVERRMLTDNLGMFLPLRAQWKKSISGVVTNVTAAGAAALDEAQTP